MSNPIVMTSIRSIIMHTFTQSLLFTEIVDQIVHWGGSCTIELLVYPSSSLLVPNTLNNISHYHLISNQVNKLLPVWEVSYLMFLFSYYRTLWGIRFWLSNPYFGTWLVLHWFIDDQNLSLIEHVVANEIGNNSQCHLTIRFIGRPSSISLHGLCLTQSLLNTRKSKPSGNVLLPLGTQLIQLPMLLSHSHSEPMLYRYVLIGVVIVIIGKQVSRAPKVRSTTRSSAFGVTSSKTPRTFITQTRLHLINKIGTLSIRIRKTYTFH